MKKFETEMLNLTYECLTRYWQKDYKFVISYCAKEVIWCGARQDEFMLSREVVEDDFRTKGNPAMSSAQCRIFSQKQCITLRYNR